MTIQTTTMPRRLGALLLCLALCLGMLPTAALAVEPKEAAGVFTVNGGTSGTDYTYTPPSEYETNGGAVLTIKSNKELTISTNSESETTSGCRIVISDNVTANITLAGVHITPADAGTNDGYSGIYLGKNATLNITLQNDSSNEINGGTSTTGSPGPGIRVPADSTLTINGKGSLQVQGASREDAAAVGIGGMGSASEAGEACGNVIILGGTITVQSGSPTSGIGNSAVDIGGGATNSGNGGDCNTVIILTSVNSDGSLEIGGGLVLVLAAAKVPTVQASSYQRRQLHRLRRPGTPLRHHIPEGATVVIPEGASLTVPENVTLTNNGTILVQGGTFTNNGTVSGNQPTYPAR